MGRSSTGSHGIQRPASQPPSPLTWTTAVASASECYLSTIHSLHATHPWYSPKIKPGPIIPSLETLSGLSPLPFFSNVLPSPPLLFCPVSYHPPFSRYAPASGLCSVYQTPKLVSPQALCTSHSFCWTALPPVLRTVSSLFVIHVLASVTSSERPSLITPPSLPILVFCIKSPLNGLLFIQRDG